MPARQWFSEYAKHFGTVEVNNTFYRLPPPQTFSNWRAQAPEGFVFSVKVSRYGTHRLKLLYPERWLPNYLERAVLLGPNLGPNLVQLPPRWKRDPGRLRDFLEIAKATVVRLAAPGNAPGLAGVKWAVEVRDPSWLHASIYDLLKEHQAALCCHDLLDEHPWLLTTSWGYARFHGPQAPTSKYNGEYTADGLREPAARIRSWLDQGCDAYAYFNNDIGGAAARDATAMTALLA